MLNKLWLTGNESEALSIFYLHFLFLLVILLFYGNDTYTNTGEEALSVVIIYLFCASDEFDFKRGCKTWRHCAHYNKDKAAREMECIPINYAFQ